MLNDERFSKANKMDLSEEAKMKIMFDSVDKNGDKEISKDELSNLLEILNKTKPSNEKLNEIFKSLDTNNDGLIDF